MILANRSEDLNIVFRVKTDGFDYLFHATTDSMKCFSCGRHGHERNACPQKKSEGQGGVKENPSQENTEEDRGDKHPDGGQGKAGGVQEGNRSRQVEAKRRRELLCVGEWG